jgi:hypothetical protein
MMARRRSVALTPVAVVTLLAALGTFSVSAAPPSGTDASEVVHWNSVAVNTLRTFPPAAGGAAPALQINLGMVQGAVYDAVNAIGRKQHQPYLLKKRIGATASVDAAVATAAYDVLASLISNSPGISDASTRLAALDVELGASLGAIDNGASKSKGIKIGHAAAKAMLDSRIGDGRFTPSTWVLNTAAGHWSPITPTALDPTQWVANTKPFLIQSTSQFQSVAPPALGSAQWATEFNEVKAKGRATGSTRDDSPEQMQTYKAKWWQSAPGLSWNEVARQLITKNDLNAADAARLLALQNLSGADAAINCWNDKYHFDFWRPWNAIQRALEDGNDATMPDADWTALITAPYPEWVSGHNCLDASHVSVLRLFFGDTPGDFQITSFFNNPGGPATRTFSTFSQPLAELIEARIWAGLHYRSGDVAGQVLGNNVANYAIENYFQAVGN